MNFNIKITRNNIPATVRGLEKIKDYLSKREFIKGPATKAGNEVVNAVRTRVSRTMDLDRRPFEFLEKDYADRKYRAHGSRLPNLVATGRMMGSMRSWVSRSNGELGVTIGFKDKRQARKASWLHRGVDPIGEGLGIPERSFMGITKGESFRIKNKLSKDILAEMRKKKNRR